MYSIRNISNTFQVPIPFPLPQEDACKNGIDCPLAPNKAYSETIQMPILSDYPCVIIIFI